MKEVMARETALDLLIDWEKNQSYSNLLLKERLQDSPLSGVDKRLVTELVYGCIQRDYTLHKLLDGLVKKGTHRLKPWVRRLLCIGLYQLIFLDRVPDHAAVHTAVQIAKARGHQGVASLVNGVLRAYQRDPVDLNQPPTNLTERSFTYSYPEWMVQRLEQVFGTKEAEALMESTLHPPKSSLRINPLRQRPTEILQECSLSSLVPEGRIYQGSGNPANQSGFKEGQYSLQDESSMLVSHLLNPRSGMRILDACAAPGGKTTHLAELMQDQGEILACDVYEHKIKLIQNQVNRLGLRSIRTEQIDARKLTPNTHGTFDAILLDVPCSGLGVIRRKPDLKWRKKPKDIKSLVALQKELLETVSKLVKPGGILLYSTCTWEPAENQDQIDSFLRESSDFVPDTSLLTLLPTLVQEKAQCEDYWVQILPHHFYTDGFFIARMKKKNS